MSEVLFICEGNVGRSQMAEAFYNQMKGKGSAISAGTDDVGEKYNFRPREDIVQVMKEKGIDISTQRIKQITETMLVEVRTIVILCNPELLPDFLKVSSLNILFKEVPDPHESTIEGVREIRDQVEKIILNLLEPTDLI